MVHEERPQKRKADKGPPEGGGTKKAPAPKSKTDKPAAPASSKSLAS